jgi:hypothetical protein
MPLEPGDYLVDFSWQLESLRGIPLRTFKEEKKYRKCFILGKKDPKLMLNREWSSPLTFSRLLIGGPSLSYLGC